MLNVCNWIVNSWNKVGRVFFFFFPCFEDCSFPRSDVSRACNSHESRIHPSNQELFTQRRGNRSVTKQYGWKPTRGPITSSSTHPESTKSCINLVDLFLCIPEGNFVDVFWLLIGNTSTRISRRTDDLSEKEYKKASLQDETAKDLWNNV